MLEIRRQHFLSNYQQMDSYPNRIIRCHYVIHREQASQALKVVRQSISLYTTNLCYAIGKTHCRTSVTDTNVTFHQDQLVFIGFSDKNMCKTTPNYFVIKIQYYAECACYWFLTLVNMAGLMTYSNPMTTAAITKNYAYGYHLLCLVAVWNQPAVPIRFKITLRVLGNHTAVAVLIKLSKEYR